MSAGLNLACAKNIQEYMSQKLNIEASQVPKMCLDLYREYGTTMAGLKALGYEFGNDEFHAYVHGRLPYERLKIDSGLRNLLMSMPQRKIVLQLLKQSLISKTPMNDVFLKKQEVPIFPVKPNEAKVKLEPSQAPVKLEPLEAEQVKLEQPFDIKHRDSKRITMKLLVSKTKNKVLCAEANEDFVDLLFSFLTFPLGSITKLLDKSSIGRVADVYKSVETLCIDGNILSESAKELLLKPKVAFHYGIKNQLVPIDEAKQWHVNILKCSTCFNESKRTCSHGLGKVNLSVTNPKFVNTVTARGAGYVKGPQTFLITDDLRVKPFSTASCMALAKDLGVPFSDLEEKEASIGEHEALVILQGSFTSNMVLTQVFCQKKRKLEDVDATAETEECKKRLNCKVNTSRGKNLIVID